MWKKLGVTAFLMHFRSYLRVIRVTQVSCSISTFPQHSCNTPSARNNGGMAETNAHAIRRKLSERRKHSYCSFKAICKYSGRLHEVAHVRVTQVSCSTPTFQQHSCHTPAARNNGGMAEANAHVILCFQNLDHCLCALKTTMRSSRDRPMVVHV